MHNFKRLSILITLSTLPIILYATQPPHTIKSWQVAEDDTAVYYSDQLSDGTETTRTITKPKPREYPVSITLVETNDLPVQLQYIYVSLYADGRTVTNAHLRTKTPRERATITLPPEPILTPQPPAKTDALGQALKRRREHSSSAALAPLATHTKTMARPDRPITSRVQGAEIIYTTESGAEIRQPLKRAHTARVKSAPL